jgi:hypothetical protein
MKRALMNRKRRTPLYFFDEHGDAFYYWHKARREGFFNEPVDLFHVDAHDDMFAAERFRRSLYFRGPAGDGYLKYYENFARTELNIGNFILPAILNGLVKNVYFIYPRWRHFRRGRERGSVGSAFGEGRVLKCGIRAGKDTDPKVFKAWPDLKVFHYTKVDIDHIPRNRRVILDIDFDYFACVDSIYNHLNFELEITRDQFLRKDLILKDKTLPFSRLDFHFAERKGRCYATVSPRKEQERSYLPSKEEIESEILHLMKAMKAANTKPAAVTISRSCVSGYCPRNYQAFIEEQLKKRLPVLLPNHIISR